MAFRAQFCRHFRLLTWRQHPQNDRRKSPSLSWHPAWLCETRDLQGPCWRRAFVTLWFQLAGGPHSLLPGISTTLNWVATARMAITCRMNTGARICSMRKPNKRQRDSTEIELRSDGWERFRTAVTAAAKSGPKHRPVKKRNQLKKRPGRNRASPLVLPISQQNTQAA